MKQKYRVKLIFEYSDIVHVIAESKETAIVKALKSDYLEELESFRVEFIEE